MWNATVHCDEEHFKLEAVQETQSNSSHFSSTSNKACDDECLRFRQTLANWNENPITKGKPKAAIYILTSERAHITTTLKSLQDNFLSNFLYPVIIFHENIEQHFRRNYPENLSKSLDIYFQIVSFVIPPFINESSILFNPACPPKRISYRHMCRFQSKLIYEEPILMGLDYYWRLDDDSQILAPISYDVFAFMQQREFLYGYVIEHFDTKQCIPCLWPAAKIYVSENNINATYFHNWSVGRMIYNNFEIASFSIWRNEKFKHFINYIDRVGGIYYYRWGDAPIKSIALSILVNRSSVYRFEDISYRHQNYATDLAKASPKI